MHPTLLNLISSEIHGVLGTILAFNLVLPDSSLKTAVVFSLLSVWVLVGLFYYLNRYTRRGYFSIWTAGWLFYALFLTIKGSLDPSETTSYLQMLQNWCIATAAVLMFWGSFSFLNLKAGHRLIGTAIIFVSIWSYAVAYQFPGEIWILIPAFLLLGGASMFTSMAFFLQRKKTPYVGIGLLTFGFGFWSIYLVAYPFLQSSEVMLSTAFLISTVLQLFIATSMIILVLEEVKTTLRLREEQILTEKGKADFFEAAAAMHQDRYQKLFENATDGILIVNRDTLEVLEMNQAARRMFHLKSVEPSVLRLRNLLVFPDQKEKEHGPAWLDRLCQSAEATLILPDEVPRRVQVRGAPISYSDSDAFELFLSELSEREKQQQHIRQREKMASLGQMVSGVAHELNNPLAAIKGFADLLLMSKGIDAYGRDVLSKVAQESERARKLVQNFLAFAQQDSAQKEKIHLNVLVASVAESRRAELERSGCESRLHLPPGDLTLSGNPAQLREALNHLITNAREAMEGRSREKILALTTYEKGDVVGIRVEDTGPGIPREIVPRIFEPFFTTRGDLGSTGLGLSIAHNVVVTHHGKIWYEKRPLGGACIVLELPKTDAPQPAAQEKAPPRSGKILIVDDEEALGAILKEILTLFGHEVSVSHSPMEALQKIKGENFDLVISDFRMPQMNGADFYAETLKFQEAYRKKFIFLTGDIVNEAAREFFSKVPVPRLLKPFEFEEVDKLIQSMLKNDGEDPLADKSDNRNAIA